MPAQTLRDYQERGLASCLAAWKAGARTLLAVLPTGGGKTTVFCHLISQLAAAGQRSLIVVHRRELATQAATRLREFGVNYGFVMAGEPSKPYAPVQIASVQTLVRRQAPPAALVVCDEAHLSTAKSWATVLQSYPNARILGVTATPFRLGGKPLAGAYDDCVIIATPRELREQDHLCNYVGFSYLTPDLSGVKTTGGDYNEKQAAAAMSGTLIVDSIVEEWGKHARDLSTVVFAVTVEHSKQLTARFRAAGATAEHLDGATPLEQRKAILRRVESGATRVLCNVGVAVEGLDIPRLKCCILARPTKSLARAIQMMGRVRRPWNGTVARIHDHAFNIKLHGLPDADRDYSLSAKPEKPPALSTCEVCLALYSGNVCPACSHENAKRELTEREMQTVADAEQFTFASAEEEPEGPRNEKPIPVRWNTIGRMIEGVFSKQWDEPTSYGKQRFYMLKAEKRDYTLPGTTQLNALMAKVPKGAKVRVTYMADTALSGGRTRKEFKVEADKAEEDPRRAEAKRLYVEENKSTKDVASILGVSSSTAYNWAKQGGWLRSQSEAKGTDLINQRFGRFVVVAKSTRQGDGIRYWECRCDCTGQIKTVSAGALLAGKSNSCGCLNRELSSTRIRTRNATRAASSP